MSDIFREVDEELQRDRALSLWRTYGKVAIAAAVGLVLGTAGFVALDNYRATQRAALAERYLDAIDLAASGDDAGAVERLSRFAADAPTGYATLARLQSAGLRAQSGDVAGAVAVYDALAADSSVEPLYREYALVLSVMHQVDSGDSAVQLARIAPLAEGEGPWRHNAIELAGLLARRGGDIARAREMFTLLVDDPSAPQALRERARELLAVLGG